MEDNGSVGLKSKGRRTCKITSLKAGVIINHGINAGEIGTDWSRGL